MKYSTSLLGRLKAYNSQMETVLLKTATGFIPQDDAMDRIKIGEGVRVKWSKSRNPGNHRRFFAFIRAVFDMQEHFEDPEMLRKWLLMKAGFVDTAVAPNGTVMFLPRSMAWDKMEEPEFQEAFDKMLTVAVQDLGLDADLINQVLEFA